MVNNEREIEGLEPTPKKKQENDKDAPAEDVPHQPDQEEIEDTIDTEDEVDEESYESFPASDPPADY